LPLDTGADLSLLICKHLVLLSVMWIGCE